MDLAKKYISTLENKTSACKSDYTLPFGIISGKATRCIETKPNRQSLIKMRIGDELRCTESPDLLDTLSRQIDNYPLHTNVRDKIGAKCSQTVIRNLRKGDAIPDNITKSMDSTHLPHPSQLVKRKRSRKLSDPSIKGAGKKQSLDDKFQFHRLQCKQRLSQFDSTSSLTQAEMTETPSLPSKKEKTTDDEKPIQAVGEREEIQTLDGAIWGETDVWIHHRWKYKTDNIKEADKAILSVNNSGIIPLTEGNDLLKSGILQHDDWYQQYKWKTMSTFNGLKNQKQEE